MLAGFQLANQLPASVTTLFSEHLLELLTEAFIAIPQEPAGKTSSQRSALFLHARRLIALKFSDPELRPEGIAVQLGISTRTLHRIFAEHGESVMHRVVSERVRRAGNLLGSAKAQGRTITEVAFSCGFNDLTHFGRVFCAQMGMMPSEWRRAALSNR
jgi:transcriptional regulator GlxA family with amidase domain